MISDLLFNKFLSGSSNISSFSVRHRLQRLIFADKTSNMYRLEKEEYHHLLQNAVTTTYKKSNKETERKINCEGIKYAKEANILDKVEINGTANCFITLKDHKPPYNKTH